MVEAACQEKAQRGINDGQDWRGLRRSSLAAFAAPRDSNDADKDFGNVTRIVTRTETDAPGVYHATRFGYAFDGRTVSFVAGESWTWNGNVANCPTGYNIEWAREFRYDSGRARYLNRVLDANQLELGNIVATNQTWTDYDGDTSYGDFSLAGNPPTVTNLRSYEPGIGKVDPWTDGGGVNTEYGMSDLLGTARGFTDRTGFPVEPAVYTAFGEIVYEPVGHKRYGYVGAWGYQQHTEFPLLHVGARYYDPASGRFLQRDPIGILGGLNAYGYVRELPTRLIDPQGSDWVDVINWIFPPDGLPRGPTDIGYLPQFPKLPAPPLAPQPTQSQVLNPIRGPAKVIENVEITVIYYGIGFTAVTLSEGIMLIYGTPLYTPYRPGTIYSKWWEGGKKLEKHLWCD